MICKEFQDLQLSALGMGTMRLPLTDGKDENIDEAATARMVEYAMNHGINYYDTAWGYHGWKRFLRNSLRSVRFLILISTCSTMSVR